MRARRSGATHMERIRQPWYEVEGTLRFAVGVYAGRPRRNRCCPPLRLARKRRPGRTAPCAPVRASGAGGDDTVDIVPCNWLQDWENIMDPFHVPILHTSFSGAQFAPEMGVMPEVTYDHADHGMKYTAYRELPDGRKMNRVTQAVLPARAYRARYLSSSRAKHRRSASCCPSSDTNFHASSTSCARRRASSAKLPRRHRRQEVERAHRKPSIRPRRAIGKRRSDRPDQLPLRGESLGQATAAWAAYASSCAGRSRSLRSGGDPLGTLRSRRPASSITSKPETTTWIRPVRFGRRPAVAAGGRTREGSPHAAARGRSSGT